VIIFVVFFCIFNVGKVDEFICFVAKDGFAGAARDKSVLKKTKVPAEIAGQRYILLGLMEHSVRKKKKGKIFVAKS
jgi:hypothetical protein